MSKAYYDDVRKRGEEMERLRAENAQLREVLDDLEWSDTDGYTSACPECLETVKRGHTKSCSVGKVLYQPSQSYERYQAMQKVCEAAKFWNSEPDDADGWANATLRLSQAVDALEALDTKS